MPTVRYTADGGHYRVGGQGFDPGDERDVDGELAEYLADHEDFAVVDGAGGDDVHEEDGPPDDSPEYAIETDDGELLEAGDATVDEIEAAIADVDDVAALEHILAAEQEGEGRTTAIEAIESRLGDLEG